MSSESTRLTISSPEIRQRVAEMRAVDNWRNWFYIAREYLFLFAVVGGSIAFYRYLADAGQSWLWAVPVSYLAIILVGAGMHRLAHLAHEAAHYALFRNRKLNELASEWLCMYPIHSTTHHYRVQHLAHHQYPNDPERDPDTEQLILSGHKFALPMARGDFLWHCIAKQFLLPYLTIRYAIVRALFKVHHDDGTPYRQTNPASAPLAIFAAIYLVSLIGLLGWAVLEENGLAIALLPIGCYAAGLAVFQLAPQRLYVSYAIKSDLSARTIGSMRLAFHTFLCAIVAALTYWTGWPWWLYFIVLWMIPLGTTFPFFMIMRQVVQHGNADRERFTNTRVFSVHPFIRFSVFPFGGDLHLPHHLFPMVPHYNLKKLHELLMTTSDYRTEAILVEGYFFPRREPPRQPTVLELMTTPTRT